MHTRVVAVGAVVTSFFASACGQVASTSSPEDAGTDVHTPIHLEDASFDAPSAVVDAAPPAVDASQPEKPPPTHAAVLFGGDGPQFFGDTWEWDGTTWTERTFETSPSPRSDMAMASLGNKVVLFGGAVGSALGDTWEYDGKAWTEKKIAGPPARQRFAMATLGDRVVLFGGLGDAGDLGDTWEYDGTAWTQKNVTGPSARTGHAMTTLEDKVVLFGGIGGGNLDDTWEYDGTTWTTLAIPGPGGPHGINFAPAMAALNGKVVLFSGELDANTIPPDTWEFDGAAWTKLAVTGPKGRWHHGMTTFDGKVLLFGGDPGSPGGGGFLGDTWTWDGASWTQYSGLGPSGRYVYSLAPR